MADVIGRAETFAGEVASLYGEELISVVLYGSAARGDFHEGVSDLNVLVLLREVDPAALRRGSSLARRWTEAGNQPPLLLGVEEWRRSADVFPIETADIQAGHRVLRGTDPFDGVRIDPEHLRLQCEHELKGKQITLRERYLLSADRPDELGQLFHGSVSTFLVLFRTVLRLAGEPVPTAPGEVVGAVARRAGFDPEPLLRVLEARHAGTPLRPAADDPIATGYLEAVARVVEWVDGFRAGAH